MSSTLARICKYSTQNGRFSEQPLSGHQRNVRRDVMDLVDRHLSDLSEGKALAIYQNTSGLSTEVFPAELNIHLKSDLTATFRLSPSASAEAILFVCADELSSFTQSSISVLVNQETIQIHYFLKAGDLHKQLEKLKEEAQDHSSLIISTENIDQIASIYTSIVEENAQRGRHLVRRSAEQNIIINPNGERVDT